MKFVNWLKKDNFSTKLTIVSTIDEFNEHLEEIEKKFKRRDFGVSTLRLTKGNGTYSVYEGQGFTEIRYIDDCVPYQIRFSHNGTKQENIGKGQEALEYFNSELKRLSNDEDITIFKVFSSKKYKNEYTAVKECVVSPFDYVNESFTSEKGKKPKILTVYKADVSSAYPYELTKSLPTFHDCLEIKGRVEPSEEYPFAFYVKSRHVKILNEFYTKDFKNTLYPYQALYRRWNPDDSVKAEDDITVLCKEEKKYSKYIKEIALDLYNNRHSNPEYKLWLNAFIGRLHINSNPFASCVAAVVIARCANNMIERCKILQSENNTPVLVNTDSISWINRNDSKVYTKEKAIGNFVLEYAPTKMVIKSVKAYQYMIDNRNYKTVFAGVDKEISKNIPFGNINNYDDPSFIFKVNATGFLEKL